MFLGIIAEVSSIVCWWINDDWQWNVHTLTRCCHRCTYTVYRMYSCCYCLKLTKNNKTNWKKYMGDLIFTLKESVCGKRNCPDQQRLVHCDVEEEVTRSLTRVNREANSSWTIANITVDLCELNNRFSPVRSNMLYAWLWPHSGKPQDNAITSFIIKKTVYWLCRNQAYDILTGLHGVKGQRGPVSYWHIIYMWSVLVIIDVIHRYQWVSVSKSCH